MRRARHPAHAARRVEWPAGPTSVSAAQTWKKSGRIAVRAGNAGKSRSGSNLPHRRAAGRSADRRRVPPRHLAPRRAAGRGMSTTSPTGTGAASRHTPPSRRATATQRLRGSTLQSACATSAAPCSGSDMGGSAMAYRYPPAARWLHWLTAALVLALIGTRRLDDLVRAEGRRVQVPALRHPRKHWCRAVRAGAAASAAPAGQPSGTAAADRAGAVPPRRARQPCAALCRAADPAGDRLPRHQRLGLSAAVGAPGADPGRRSARMRRWRRSCRPFTGTARRFWCC